MRNNIQLIFLLLLLFRSNIYSQETGIEQKMEEASGSLDDENIDYTSLSEQLQFFKEHPIDLNTASAEELAQLPLLNSIQITNMLEHIRKTGNIISLYELQSINGFDLTDIRQLFPFVTVHSGSEYPLGFSDMIKYGKQTLLLREYRVLEQQKGYTDSAYAGTPDKIYTRYRYSYGNRMSIGLTAEKDAGEAFFKGSEKNGFDFYSAHLFIQSGKKLKCFALGDYMISAGQGLILWSNVAFNKTFDAINIKKSNSTIRPYLSTDENLFMRGAAATIALKQTELTTFISHHSIDGNVMEKNKDHEVTKVYSLYNTGLHTNASELYDKHSVMQTVGGIHTNTRIKKINIGLTAMHTGLSADVLPSSQFYNRFYFSGSQLNNAGIDYSFSINNFNFFGEAAAAFTGNKLNDQSGYALLNGFVASVDQKVSVGLLYRNYSAKYHSFFSNGFGENYTTSNEKGFYSSINIKPAESISINAYYDLFRFPWLKYEVNAPSIGKDAFIQFNYTPDKKLEFYFRFRDKQKYKNETLVAAIDHPEPVRQTNYRFNLTYKTNKWLTLRSRIELIEYYNEKGEKERGSLICQDVIIKRPARPLSFNFRYALFDTKSYDSRIYAYENDLPYSWSVPSYYYKGSKIYLVLQYQFRKKMQAGIKYSQTWYANKTIISEYSPAEIRGNIKSEIKVQVNFNF